jgi:hypothetical protein
MGVPFGVLLTLSTRLCLFPDRGVTLFALRYGGTGEATSSRWPTAPVLVLGVSDLTCNLLVAGETTVAVWYGCCLPTATFGVKGWAAPRLSPLATAGLSIGIWGCRTEVVLAFAAGAILLGVALSQRADKLGVLSWRRGPANALRSHGANGVRAGTGAGKGPAKSLLVGGDAIAADEVELRKKCDRARCVVILVDPPASGVTPEL